MVVLVGVGLAVVRKVVSGSVLMDVLVSFNRECHVSDEAFRLERDG